MGDLDAVAAKYRIINIDADPDAKNFSAAQIETLKAHGRNRVLSYLDVGSCEKHRSYWRSVPSGFTSCGANARAQLGAYEDYDDETWMDPSNEEYARLIVDHVAARLAARGVDGFYLDNLELLSHGPTDANGPCSARCRQGGLDLVHRLRERFPDLLLVMQNGTTDVTRLGTTHGTAFVRLLDGIVHEEVYAPSFDAEAERQLLAWKAMNLRTRTGRPFWIGVEDYAGSCRATAIASAAAKRAAAQGFSSYVSDASAGQQVICEWP
jgi:cysteinyl-tRNA synthetase